MRGRWTSGPGGERLWLYPSGALAEHCGGRFRGRIPDHEIPMSEQSTFLDLIGAEPEATTAAPPKPKQRRQRPPENDRKRAQAARDAALSQVEENASEAEEVAVMRAIRIAAGERNLLTTDHVRPHIRGTVREPRLLGALMRKAQSRGWIEPTPRYADSDHVESHGRPKRLWKSLLRR